MFFFGGGGGNVHGKFYLRKLTFAYRLACVAWRFCRAGRRSGVATSSRFLCPRPPLLLSSPNQNRHATQATSLVESRIHQIFVVESGLPGRWNPEYSSRNAESIAWNSESKTVLDSLTRAEL